MKPDRFHSLWVCTGWLIIALLIASTPTSFACVPVENSSQTNASPELITVQPAALALSLNDFPEGWRTTSSSDGATLFHGRFTDDTREVDCTVFVLESISKAEIHYDNDASKWIGYFPLGHPYIGDDAYTVSIESLNAALDPRLTMVRLVFLKINVYVRIWVSAPSGVLSPEEAVSWARIIENRIMRALEGDLPVKPAPSGESSGIL